MRQSYWVTLENCSILNATQKALEIEHNGEIFWLPKSQIEDPDRLKVGDSDVTVLITEWIADQKGIEGD
jgi:hypothetical protein